jgi:hypothetical protein
MMAAMTEGSFLNAESKSSLSVGVRKNFSRDSIDEVL